MTIRWLLSILAINASQPQPCASFDATRAVAAVNGLRSLHGAPPVRWDGALSSYAQQWSDRMASSGAFAHSPVSSYGENIAMVVAASGDSAIASALATWYAEGGAYDYSSGSPYVRLQHFTQVVWASTTRIGAGVAASKTRANAYYVVMEFAPAGNYQGRYVSNVFPLMGSNVFPLRGSNATTKPPPGRV